MTTVALLLFSIAAPTVQMSIAPDQPIPYVYADDPVILQINSDTDGTATGQVTITGDNNATVTIPLEDLPLRANGAHWQPLDAAPKELGRYRAHVTLNSGGGQFDSTLVYCRIARPAGDIGSLLRVRIRTDQSELLHAVRGIPLQRVTAHVSSPALTSITSAQPGNDFRVTVGLTLDSAANSEITEPLVATGKEKIESWRISLKDCDVVAIEPAILALRQSAGRVPVEFALGAEANLSELLANGLGRVASTFVVASEDYDADGVNALHTAAERAGYESMMITVTHKVNQDRTTQELMQGILNSFGNRTSCEFDAEDLYANESFSEAYPMLSGLVHRVSGYSFAGDYGDGSGVHGKIFRAGNSWLLAIWASKPAAEHAVLVGEAKDLALFDAWGNPLSSPGVTNGIARFAVSDSPQYLCGTGGMMLAYGARMAARREAEQFVKDRWLQQDLPKEFQDILKPIASQNFARADRVTFFAMLRMFPVLEQKWHDGSMRRDVAVPAMASLSRLARSLCVLEQASGEPFIELLQETLARCGEYQSKYLTSTGGSESKHDRAEWLLAEVARLTAEAKMLSEAGLAIEAVGVASLAEWRARSLEFAINAQPLGVAEPPRAAPAIRPKASSKKAPATRNR